MNTMYPCETIIYKGWAIRIYYKFTNKFLGQNCQHKIFTKQ